MEAENLKNSGISGNEPLNKGINDILQLLEIIPNKNYFL
jgi:hypothetical protein